MRGNEADDRKLWAADANWTLKRHLNGNEIFSQDLGGNEEIGKIWRFLVILSYFAHNFYPFVFRFGI